MHTKGSNNQHGEKMIQKSGPIIWNDIPDHIQGAPSIQAFKTNLKKHFFSQYDVINSDNNEYRRIYNTNNHNNNHSNNSNSDNTSGNITFKRPWVSRWDT